MADTDNKSVVGWLWVGAQVILLAALIFLPGRDDWATPTSIETVGRVIFLIGVVLVTVAGFGLGRALTPTPVPTADGELTTTGFYKFVRHPIYTGVLTIVLGLTIRSGSFVHLAIAVVTVLFFDRKAAWEERQLVETYPGYPAYAAKTPKFIPGLRRFTD